MAPELRKRLTKEDLLQIIAANEHAKLEENVEIGEENKSNSNEEDMSRRKRKKKRCNGKAQKIKRISFEIQEGIQDCKKDMKSPFISASLRPKIRDRIIEMHKSGVKHSAIARKLKTTTSTVTRWIKRFDETGNTEANYHKNRPKTHQAEQADFIVDYICGIPVNEDELQKIFVSYTTIQRRIKIRYEEFCSGKVKFIKEYKEALENFMFNKDGKKPEMLRKILKGAYDCSVCDRTFKNNCQKLKHELCHTDRKPYPCRFCEKSFRAPHNVLVHERIHTGEKPYLCRFCEKRFIDIGNCYKHISNRHKELQEEAKGMKIRSVIRIKNDDIAEKVLERIKNENKNKLSRFFLTSDEDPNCIQEKPNFQRPKIEISVPVLTNPEQSPPLSSALHVPSSLELSALHIPNSSEPSALIPAQMAHKVNRNDKNNSPPQSIVDELVRELISPITTLHSVNVASNGSYNKVPARPASASTHPFIPYPAHMQPTNLAPPLPLNAPPQPTHQPYSHSIYHHHQSPHISLPHSVFSNNIAQYR